MSCPGRVKVKRYIQINSDILCSTALLGLGARQSSPCKVCTIQVTNQPCSIPIEEVFRALSIRHAEITLLHLERRKLMPMQSLSQSSTGKASSPGKTGLAQFFWSCKRPASTSTQMNWSSWGCKMAPQSSLLPARRASLSWHRPQTLRHVTQQASDTLTIGTFSPACL